MQKEIKESVSRIPVAALFFRMWSTRKRLMKAYRRKHFQEHPERESFKNVKANGHLPSSEHNAIACKPLGEA